MEVCFLPTLIKESQKDAIRSCVSHIRSYGQSPPQSEEKWVNYIENCSGVDFPDHRISAIAAWAFEYSSNEQYSLSDGYDQISQLPPPTSLPRPVKRLVNILSGGHKVSRVTKEHKYMLSRLIEDAYDRGENHPQTVTKWNNFIRYNSHIPDGAFEDLAEWAYRHYNCDPSECRQRYQVNVYPNYCPPARYPPPATYPRMNGYAPNIYNIYVVNR
eukprot:811287_1